MKKNNFFLLIILMFIFMMVGCSKPNLNSDEKITAPKNKLAPIEGTWKVSSAKSFKNGQSEKNTSLIGTLAEFNSSAALFDNEVCKDPEYKVKVVDANTYFLYNFKVNYKDLGINNKNIQVISVNCKDKLFYDFIRITENKIMVYVDGIFFSLDKISSKTDDLSKIGSTEIQNKNLKKQDSLTRSGVFITLRKDSNDINKSPSTYRTLWISAINKSSQPLMETKGLFVPRKSGFWFINSNRINSNGFSKDNLYAYSLDNKEKHPSNISSEKPILSENLFRKINFIGNDFICTEYSKDNDNSNTLDMLKVLPIDGMENPAGIKISDLIGETGKNILVDSAQSFLSLHTDKKSSFENEPPSEESFTIVRKNGHWIMQGRLNSSSNINDFVNFDLSIFPPKKLLNYDELYVSWNTIKSKVPSALDAFTSPNKDFALIVCENCIYMYAINNGVLSESPIDKINLSENESIIMAEWATGTYMERWREYFKTFINTKNKV